MCQTYYAFQLHIRSAIALPELQVLDKEQAKTADVLIEFGAVPETGLDAPSHQGAFYQASDNTLWIDVPEVARYLITNGTSIIIEPYLPVDETSIRVFLLGSCMGAILMQRSLLLLHANAIKIKDQCVAFAGHSGAGKSTLAAAFMKAGDSILADDVCAINQTGHVVPGFPQLKLWADTSEQLSVDTQKLTRIRPNIRKFALPLHEQFHKTPLPLRVIYILSSHNQDTFLFKEIKGMQKILPLKHNTYRGQYLKGLGKTQEHLKQSGRLASQADMIHITRPSHGFKLNELMQQIKQDLSGRGIT